MNRKNGACKTFLCVLAVGTAALLTARFIAEATTIGTDIAVSGTFSVSGLSSLTGNVGVASSSPWSKFSVEMGTEEYSFAVSNSGSSTPALVIGGVNRNGNIGIGTTTPDSVLHIYRSVPFKTGVESTPLVMIESDLTGAQDSIALAIGERIGLGSVVLGYAPSANDNSSLLYVPSSGILMSGSDAPSGLSIITQNASGPIRFATGGTAFSNERLRITAGGNLGIGTTVPIQLLEIAGASAPTLAVTDTTNAVRAGLGSGDTFGAVGTLSADNFALITNSTSVRASIIHSTGYFGIGTSSPFGLLSVEQGDTGPLFVVGDEGTSTPHLLIDGRGRLQIGGGAYISSHLSNIVLVNFPSIPGPGCDTQTTTVTGAIAGDVVSVGALDALLSASSTLVMTAWVSSADTVSIRLCQVAVQGTSDLTATLFRVDVWRH